jgi:copper chaperone NosL
MAKVIFIIAVLLIIATACQTTHDFERPPEIRYGEDICYQCGMIISEPRFAAAYVTRQGISKIFDDIGELLIHFDESGDDVVVFWVHDYEDGTWIRATEAYFIENQNVITPMGHGLIAFHNVDHAEALAAKLGTRSLSFDQLLVAYKG